jgi:hypothetical protein
MCQHFQGMNAIQFKCITEIIRNAGVLYTASFTVCN